MKHPNQANQMNFSSPLLFNTITMQITINNKIMVEVRNIKPKLRKNKVQFLNYKASSRESKLELVFAVYARQKARKILSKYGNRNLY